MAVLSSPEKVEKALRLRELSPRALHAALDGILGKLSTVTAGDDADLSTQEYAVLVQWLRFSRDMSAHRIELLQKLAEQVPKVGYEETEETMLLAMIDNWFFAEGVTQDKQFEQLRKTVFDKTLKRSGKDRPGGVRIAGERQSYHRPEWGTTLRKKGTEVVGGKGKKQDAPKDR